MSSYKTNEEICAFTFKLEGKGNSWKNICCNGVCSPLTDKRASRDCECTVQFATYKCFQEVDSLPENIYQLFRKRDLEDDGWSHAMFNNSFNKVVPVSVSLSQDQSKPSKGRNFHFHKTLAMLLARTEIISYEIFIWALIVH